MAITLVQNKNVYTYSASPFALTIIPDAPVTVGNLGVIIFDSTGMGNEDLTSTSITDSLGNVYNHFVSAIAYSSVVGSIYSGPITHAGTPTIAPIVANIYNPGMSIGANMSFFEFSGADITTTVTPPNGMAAWTYGIDPASVMPPHDMGGAVPFGYSFPYTSTVANSCLLFYCYNSYGNISYPGCTRISWKPSGSRGHSAMTGNLVDTGLRNLYGTIYDDGSGIANFGSAIAVAILPFAVPPFIDYDITHTIDAAVIVANADVSHIIDASVFGSFNVIHSLDTLVSSDTTKSHAINALLSVDTSKTHTISGYLVSDVSKIHSVDVSVQLDSSKAHNLSSYVCADSNKTHLIDALASLPALPQYATYANDYSYGTSLVSSSISAYTANQLAGFQFFFVNSHAGAGTVGTPTGLGLTWTLVKEQFNGSSNTLDIWTANGNPIAGSIALGGYSAAGGNQSSLIAINTGSLTGIVQIKTAVVLGSMSATANMGAFTSPNNWTLTVVGSESNISSLTVNGTAANLLNTVNLGIHVKTSSVTSNAMAVTSQNITGSYVVMEIAYGTTQQLNHSVDSYIQSTSSPVHYLDCFLAPTNSISHSVDCYLLITNLFDISGYLDAVVSSVASVIHSISGVVRSDGSKPHSLDAMVNISITNHTHTLDGFIKLPGTNDLVQNLDAVISDKVSVVFSDYQSSTRTSWQSSYVTQYACDNLVGKHLFFALAHIYGPPTSGPAAGNNLGLTWTQVATEGGMTVWMAYANVAPTAGFISIPFPTYATYGWGTLVAVSGLKAYLSNGSDGIIQTIVGIGYGTFAAFQSVKNYVLGFSGGVGNFGTPVNPNSYDMIQLATNDDRSLLTEFKASSGPDFYAGNSGAGLGMYCAFELAFNNDVNKRHSIDADVQGLQTIAHAVDAMIWVPTIDKTHSLSASILKEIDKNHAFGALVSIDSLMNSFADGYVLVNQNVIHLLDADIQSETSITHILGAVMQLDSSKNHSVSMLVQVYVDRSNFIDAFVMSSVDFAHSIDSFVIVDSNVNHSVSAAIQTDSSISSNLSAMILMDYNKSHSISSYIQGLVGLNHSIDSIMIRETSLTHSISAFVVRETSLNSSIGAVLYNTAATFISPIENDSLYGNSLNWVWNTGVGVDHYVFGISGNSGWGGFTWGFVGWGADSSLAVPITTYETSLVASGLPQDGSIITASLTSYNSLGQQVGVAQQASYTSAAGKGGVITSPAPGSKLMGPQQLFLFTPGVSVYYYELMIGTAIGLQDISYTWGLSNSLYLVGNNIPFDGSNIYIRLNTIVYKGGNLSNGVITFSQDYIYLTSTPTSRDHIVDAIMQTTSVRSHSLSAYLVPDTNKAHSMDAYVRPDNSVNHSIDARVQGLQVIIHSLDALVNLPVNKTHSLDAYAVFTTTSTIIHSVNAMVIVDSNKSHNYDCLIVADMTVSSSIDAMIQGFYNRDNTLDALLQLTSDVNHTVGGYLQSLSNLNHRLDGLLQKTTYLNQTIGALINTPNMSINHSFGCLIHCDANKIHSIDAQVMLPIKTITGTLGQLTSNNYAAKQITFTLQNFGSGMVSVSGVGVMVPTPLKVTADNNGAFNVKLYGNDVISPAGTFYMVTFIDEAGMVLGNIPYKFINSGPFDLNNFQPTVI